MLVPRAAARMGLGSRAPGRATALVHGCSGLWDACRLLARLSGARASARATRTLCQFHSCPRPTPPHLTSSIPSLAPASWEGRVTNHPLPTHPPTNLGTPEGTMMQGRPHKVVRTRRYRARFAFEPKSQRRVGGTLDLNASACWPRLPCVWVISFCVHQCFFAGNGVHPWEE